MSHLIFFVISMLDGRLLLATMLGCVIGATLVLAMTLRTVPRVRDRLLHILAFGAVASLLFWCLFIGALKAGFPKLGIDLSVRGFVPALAVSCLAASATETIRLFSRRSVRTVMLMGSVFACGLSLMVFSGMAVLVRPFALAYDLRSVLAVIGLGATLAAFAFWEAGDRIRPHRPLMAIPLLAAALLVLSVGSLGSILPFDQWITASTRPDDLATSPIAIVLAAETGVGLLLVLSGSLLDSWAAARDRREIQRVRHLADSSFEGILIHRHGQILDANARLLRMTGYNLAEIKQVGVNQLVLVPQQADRPSGDGETDQDQEMPVETRITGKDGNSLPVELLSRAIHYAGGPAEVTALRDIRDRREAEERIRHLAHHDALTDLPIGVIWSRLSTRLCASRGGRRPGSPSAVWIWMVSRRSTTRWVMRRATCCCGKSPPACWTSAATATWWRGSAATSSSSCCRPGWARSVPRWWRSGWYWRWRWRSISTVSSPTSAPASASRSFPMMGRPRRPCSRAPTPRSTGRRSVVGASSACSRPVWIARPRSDESSSASCARRCRRRRCRCTTSRLFDGGGGIIAFEALIRWQHPTRGAGPAGPLHSAERSECGLILPIGEWVLRTACRTAASWAHERRVAVNLSPRSSSAAGCSIWWQRYWRRRGCRHPGSSSRSPKAC